MCFDLEIVSVVSRQTIKRLPMPDRVINVINDWGKSQENTEFKNKLEFWDCPRKKYDWENEDLDVSDGKVEVEPVSNFPHKPVEIPGVRIESDLQP